MFKKYNKISNGVKNKIIASVGLWALPLFALAQNPFLTILGKTKQLLDATIPIVITIALIYFIYGVAKYVAAGDEEKKEEARNVMIYGTIGLFFIVSVWGIVLLLQQFTGVQPLQAPPTIPGVPNSGSGFIQFNIPLFQLGF